MDRRNLIKAAGISALGTTLAASSTIFADHHDDEHDGHDHPNTPNKRLLIALQACETTGNHCLNHSLVHIAHHPEDAVSFAKCAHHTRGMLAHVDALLSLAHAGEAIPRDLYLACAKACEDCKKVCDAEGHARTHGECARCTKACAICARICRHLANA